MSFERKQLDCGCEVYVSSNDAIQLCPVGRELTDALIDAVDEWLPGDHPEVESKMPAAQEADRALSRHLHRER